MEGKGWWGMGMELRDEIGRGIENEYSREGYGIHTDG